MAVLTAKEAREISAKNDPNKMVEAILARVKAAAENGDYSIRVRDFGFGGSEYYQSPTQWPLRGKEVIEELRKLGFSADINSECRQFVDIWLDVSWAKVGAA